MVEYSGQRLNNVNPVRLGTTYYLPAENKAFYLDNTRGKEAIYVFVSPTPRTNIEDLSFALEKPASRADATAQQTAQQSSLTLFKSRSLPLIPATIEHNAPTFTFSQDGVNIEAIASAFKTAIQNQQIPKP